MKWNNDYCGFYSKVIIQSRPETIGRYHRWWKRLFFRRFCRQLSRNQDFSTFNQNHQFYWEWVGLCSLFFSSMLTISCKRAYLNIFAVGVLVLNIPRGDSSIFQTRSLFLLQVLISRSPQNALRDCASDHWKTPYFIVGITESFSCREHTASYFHFCIHCFLNTYSYHNKNFQNYSDNLLFSIIHDVLLKNPRNFEEDVLDNKIF